MQVHDALGGVRAVGAHLVEHGGDVVGAPRLVLVVRAEVGDEQVRAAGGQARGDGAADALAAADPGDQGDPAA